jgi:tetratricopeptide (TPR) repeat protein
MARSAQKRRPRKPKTTQVRAKPRRPERPAYEQQMFFPRLIRQAKWAFVFLALVFGVGFVVFGVGGNIPGTGFGDILQGGQVANPGGPSVGEARDKIEDDPKNATAYRELGQALVGEGRQDEAIDAYERYIDLSPKDVEVKRELANLYLTRANVHRDEYEQARAEAETVGGGGLFGPPQDSDFGRGLGGKIDQELQTVFSTRLNDAAEKMTAAYYRASTLYAQVVATRPDDEALLQLQLGDAAYSARRIPLARKAYTRFLQLAPEDQNAAYAREQLKALKAAAAGVPQG